MPLNILIVGAGVCGPALAILIQNSNPRHNITVVERSPSLRAAGQQIDLKNQGYPIVKNMGLLDTIKAHCVEEEGVEIVDTNGKTIAQFGVNEADGSNGNFSLTFEYEIMRGDLVKVFYEASLERRAKFEKELGKEGGLTYEFGKSVIDLIQNGDSVDVVFSDGQKRRYDVVIGADGQGSRTRRLAFGQQTSDNSFKSLGIHAAFYSIPRLESEGNRAKIHNAPGRRVVVTRTGNRPVTQAYLLTMKDTDMLKKQSKQPKEKQIEAWTETFKDISWQRDRFLSGMKTTDDFYAVEIGQVKMERLHSGRVVLVGDAGFCPSPMTGQGTTLSLIGAYVLAGELARHDNDVDGALSAYEEKMRTPVKESQQLSFGVLRAFMPSSRLGIRIVRTILWAISYFRLDQVMHRLLPEEGRWKIPEYPELNLGS